MTKFSKRMQRILGKVQRDRKGAISIIAAMSMTAVMGFAGLGTEVAYWYVKERDMQAATDSAAIAGAASIMTGDTQANAVSAANTSTTQYGFTGGVGGCSATTATVVCINSPPAHGTHTTDTKAVEVVVSQVQNRLFSSFFMSSNPTFTTRAVATQVGVSAPSCIITLDTTTVQPDLVDNGTANVSMQNCNVFINSCDKNFNVGAMKMSGNGTWSANAVYMCGVLDKSGASTFSDTTGTYQNTNTTYQDPYQNTNPPSHTSCGGSYPGRSVTTTQTLTPGTYCGGLQISGGNVDLAPGTYIMDGHATGQTGFDVNGNANVSCSQCTPNSSNGVTIVLTGESGNYANVKINGTGSINLKAPMPGAGSGMPPFLFYQDRATPTGGTGSQINGNSTSNFQGAMYFPTQMLTMNGNSTIAGSCTQIVSYQLTFNGTNNFNNNSTFDCQDIGIKSLAAPGGTSVALVE